MSVVVLASMEALNVAAGKARSAWYIPHFAAVRMLYWIPLFDKELPDIGL
jgi:hypothetical protein